jgi:1-hydroxycarotenoid 3,4-desaturase
MRQTHTVIVVGAGAGGLASAISAAAAGFDVTVVERSNTPGGKMRQLSAGGRPVDAGPTVLTMRWVFEQLFALAGADLGARIGLKQARLLARHGWRDGARLDLFADIEDSARAIADFSDRENAEGYRRFAADSAAMFSTLKPSYINAQRPGPLALVKRIGLFNLGDQLALKPLSSMWSALGSYFSDPRLQQLFGRYATYCGSSPFMAPATLMLVAHVEQDGIWLADGGMHAVARAMERLAVDLGVRIRYGSDVEQIDTSNGRVAGVTLAGGERLAADNVIFNGDVSALAALTGEAGNAGIGRTPPAARSLSAVTFAMTARTSGFPLAHHNVFFSDDYAAEFEALAGKRTMPLVPTTYICAQDRSHEGGMPDGHDGERMLFILNAPADGDTKTFTTKETGECLDQALDHLSTCGLDVDRSAMEVVPTTPDQFHRLFPATGGSAVRPGLARLDGLVPEAGSPDADPGPVSGGRQRPSGSGRSDGDAFRHAGGGEPGRGPRFDAAVPPGGYLWWYVDGLSDCGRYGLSVIAFVGSVFSPYYHWAGRRDPDDHVCINVALYRPGGNRWSMTERGRRSMLRDAGSFHVGPSSIRREGADIVIDFDEVSVPRPPAQFLPRRIKGSIRFSPDAVTSQVFDIDQDGLHKWWPVSPTGRITLDMDGSTEGWSGHGYMDSNWGTEPLEEGFRIWDWARGLLPGGDAVILYDSIRKDGGRGEIALRIGRDGDDKPVRDAGKENAFERLLGRAAFSSSRPRGGRAQSAGSCERWRTGRSTPAPSWPPGCWGLTSS